MPIVLTIRSLCIRYVNSDCSSAQCQAMGGGGGHVM
jgi:hypothetical protein